MYRTFKVNSKQALRQRTGTDGYQPKFLVDEGKYFLKVQCKLSGEYMDDWRVENIASRVGTSLGFNIIKQNPCNVILTEDRFERQLKGVYSVNFEQLGLKYRSFESIVNTVGIETKRNEAFIKMSNTDKMRWMASLIAKTTFITYNEYLDYLIKTAIIDIIVGNADRHTRNFGVVFNSNTQKDEIAPIFDCGMGLFEHDIWIKHNADFETALSQLYIEPYSEDPIRLLHDIDKDFGIKSKLRKNLYKLDISPNIFPSKKAYKYYKLILKELGC